MKIRMCASHQKSMRNGEMKILVADSCKKEKAVLENRKSTCKPMRCWSVIWFSTDFKGENEDRSITCQQVTDSITLGKVWIVVLDWPNLGLWWGNPCLEHGTCMLHCRSDSKRERKRKRKRERERVSERQLSMDNSSNRIELHVTRLQEMSLFELEYP